MTQPSNETTPSSDMQKTLGNLIVTVYVIGALALIAYVGFFAFIQRARLSSDPGDWGTLGDYFGGLLNPVVSFATLVVAYAVWKQQKEELKATKEALEEQAKTAEQQRREQRFFDLLNLYERTEESITFTEAISASADSSAIHLKGKAALHRLLADSLPRLIGLFQRHGIKEIKVDGSSISVSESSLSEAWNKSATASQLDHYFRVVFRLLADSESLLGPQHFQYVKLLRAQLGRAELTLLGFNLWLDIEGKRMVPLAARYGLLKHLPPGHLRKELESKLPPEVFGRKFVADVLQSAEVEHVPC